MKLILCKECCDVVKLDFDTRSCKCEAVAGRYREDGSHAIVSDNAVCIGIDNHTLAARIRQDWIPALDGLRDGNFHAWVFPNDYVRIERVSRTHTSLRDFVPQPNRWPY